MPNLNKCVDLFYGMGLLSANEVGERIRTRREQLGLDQSGLAARLGGSASQGLVSNWECGRVRPSRDYLIRLAGILGLAIEELLVDVRPPRGR